MDFRILSDEQILKKLQSSPPYTIKSFLSENNVNQIFENNIADIYERFIPGPYIPELRTDIFELSQYYSHNSSVYLNVIRAFATDDLSYIKTIINKVNVDSIIGLALRYNRLDWLPVLKIDTELTLETLESNYISYYYEYLRFISPKKERIFDVGSSSSSSSGSSVESNESSGGKKITSVPRFDRYRIEYSEDVNIEALQYSRPDFINIKRLNYTLHGPNMDDMYTAYTQQTKDISNEYQFVGTLLKGLPIEPEVIYVYISLYPQLASYLYKLPTFVEFYEWMRNQNLLDNDIWSCLPYMDIINLITVLNSIDYTDNNVSYYLWMTAVNAMNTGEGVKAAIISKYCANIFDIPITSIVYPSVVGLDSAISDIFIRKAYEYEPESIVYYSAYISKHTYQVSGRNINMNYNQLVGLGLASIHYERDLIITFEGEEVYPYWDIYDINFNVYLTADYKSYIYVYNIEDVIAGVILGGKLLGYKGDWYITTDKRKFTKLIVN